MRQIAGKARGRDGAPTYDDPLGINVGLPPVREIEKPANWPVTWKAKQEEARGTAVHTARFVQTEITHMYDNSYIGLPGEEYRRESRMS